MYILRTKTNDGIRTFEFETLTDAKTAARYVKLTSADGFVAIPGSDSMHGKLVEKWENHSTWGDRTYSTLSYSQRQRPYADHVSYWLGTEEECKSEAEKINAQITCWASRSADASKLVGSLWRLTITDPFTD